MVNGWQSQGEGTQWSEQQTGGTVGPRLSLPCNSMVARAGRCVADKRGRPLVDPWRASMRAKHLEKCLPSSAVHPYRRRGIMVLRDVPFRAATALSRHVRSATRAAQPLLCRHASSEAVREVESASSLEVPPPSQELVKGYDPVARSRLRRRGKQELPPSRYGHAMAQTINNGH